MDSPSPVHDSPIKRSSVIASPTQATRSGDDNTPLDMTLEEIENKRRLDIRITKERERRTIEQIELQEMKNEEERKARAEEENQKKTAEAEYLRKKEETRKREEDEEYIRKKEEHKKKKETYDEDLPDYGGGSPAGSPRKKRKVEHETSKQQSKKTRENAPNKDKPTSSKLKPETKKHSKEKPKPTTEQRSPPRGADGKRKEYDQISFSSSEESWGEEILTRGRIKRLTKELRNETAGGKRFSDFPREEYSETASLFVHAGFYTLGDIRLMQENARQFFLTDLRKSNSNRKTIKDLRLLLCIFQLFEIQKDDEKPKYEEITIPVKLKGWNPRLSDLKGLLLPDQDACNFFSFELAKGRCKKPPMVPFVVGEMSLKPWMPNESAHVRAMEGWVSLQKTHKRPSNTTVSFQAWITYSLRFILAGDLASAWKTFGGLAAQLSHLGTVLNIATLENATIAMTYDMKVRHYANELSKMREKDSEIIALLLNEDQRLKREALRDCGFTQTFAHIPGKDTKRSQEKGVTKNTKRSKGKQQRGKGKGSKSRKNDGWKTRNNDWSHSWTQGKRNDWIHQNNDTSEGSADKTKTSDDKTSAEENKVSKKKK